MATIHGIATSSVEEGLDFAMSLLSGRAAMAARANPSLAEELLSLICMYISLRYVGEWGLALEYIEGIADEVPPEHMQNDEQLRDQIAWLRDQMTE